MQNIRCTITDGQWSPANIPTCVPENHPAIKWEKKDDDDDYHEHRDH